MAEVKSNGKKYNSSYAIQNAIEYYSTGDKPGTNWQYWTAYGVDNTDIEVAKRQMMDTKMKYTQFNGVQMHQIFVTIPYAEINGMIQKPELKAEYCLVELIGKYFYSYGLQNISFVYRNGPGIFIRVIVNSTSLRSGKVIGNIKPFVKELNEYLNYYIQTH